jgi:membrane carboxypeptidase/penicillin-binding protein PbpC
VVEVWPPDVASWLASREASGEGERRSGDGVELAIVSPRRGAEYVIAGNGTSGDVLHMETRAAAGAEWVYWFVDGEFLSRSAPGQIVCWPLRLGRHEVLVSDGTHSAAPVAFTVTQAPAGPTR